MCVTIHDFHTRLYHISDSIFLPNISLKINYIRCLKLISKLNLIIDLDDLEIYDIFKHFLRTLSLNKVYSLVEFVLFVFMVNSTTFDQQ